MKNVTQKYWKCSTYPNKVLTLCRFMRQVCFLFAIFAIFIYTSCSRSKQQQFTPWGTALEQEADTVATDFTLDDILHNGELIMLTLTGPESYYDYHGRGMGVQYLLCEKFAQAIGVSLRVEVCKDTAELLRRLDAGEGDIAAFALPKSSKDVIYCGFYDQQKQTSWAVATGNEALADTLNRWFKPSLVAQVQREQDFAFSSQSVTRHVYSPMLNRSKGVISHYDHLFMKYAPVARWDWRLLAAQCYQESTFDPKARSWAGACGLMQIMPETADRLGLARSQLFEAEPNIAAAVKYIDQLNKQLRDIPDKMERTNFVLASYNGGYHHIRDAMALAKKHGRDPHRWIDVSQFVLGLREAKYYNDPIVKYGYMRGNETVDYVSRIRSRWSQYRGSASIGSFSGSFGTPTPQKATKKYRFHI